MAKKKIIIGISGASAPIYGIRALELLGPLPEIETHLVYTRAAQKTIELETEYSIDQIIDLADCCYRPDDIAAAISSGSYRTEGMIIAPCSMSTLACIATSVTKGLLTRAADVVLKERRTLVLLVRESPLHLGHLKRMVEVSEMGAIVAPPIPAFYHRPKSIDELINFSIGRALDVFDIDLAFMKRWGGQSSAG
jgi:4-hydroxy-3-polyprenylbenzoate decarboxylase